MPKEGWKIDEFSQGINDYSDPKDIESAEFPVLDNVFIGKKGQARAQGAMEKNTSVDSLSLSGTLISGKGLHKLQNDYSFDSASTDNSIIVNINHVTQSSDLGLATATFTIEDLVSIINGQPTAGKVRFRLKLVGSGGTTYLMADDAGSDLFDFEASSNAIDDEAGGDNVDRFDNPLTANDVVVNITDSGYGGGGQNLFAKNTNGWNIGDNPQINDSSVTMGEVFGTTDSYSAIGFYYLDWSINANFNGTSYHPYHDYGSDYTTDIWDSPNNSNQNDYSSFEAISYQYSRLAFAQWLVGEINDYTGTSGWKAELLGTEPFGNQDEPDGPTIKLISNTENLSFNDLTIRPEFSESASISGGGASALVNTPWTFLSTINTELSDDYVNVSGDYGILRLVGDKITSGATTAVADVWNITLNGDHAGGKLFITIIKNSDSSQFDFEINLSNSPEVLIDTIEALIDGECSSFLSSAQTSPTVLRLTASSTGTNSGFHVFAHVDYDSNVFDFTKADEQTVLISEQSNNSNVTIDNAGTIKKSGFSLFSKNANVWSNNFNSIDIRKGKNFNWVYGSNTNYKSNPCFYDEGSRLRLVDSNFKLPNKNKYFGFTDNSKHFFNLDGIAQWSYNANVVPIGFVCQDNDKYWRYTVGDSSYSNDTNYGVVKNAYENISSNTWASGQDTKLKLYIYKHTGGNDGIDWDESVIKVYATVIYDDNSESMPGHIFELGSGTNLLNMGAAGDADTLRIEAYFRPQNSGGNFCFPDRRIQGVHLYYSDEKEEHETLWDLGIIDFHNGFKKASAITTVDSVQGNETVHQWNTYNNVQSGLRLHDGTNTYIEYKSAPKTMTFEDYNGYSIVGVTTTSQLRYKSACIAGRRTFIGNIEVTEGSKKRIYNDRMVMSPVNDLDTFPYPSNVLDLDISDGDEIVALASMGDKVVQFKKNIAYVINISTGVARDFFVESRHKYKGILNKYAWCDVGDSIFWFNKNSAYLFDGETVQELINKKDGDASSQRLDIDVWSAFVSEDSICKYNPKTKEVFVLKKTSHSQSSDGDAYVYNVTLDAWTKSIQSFFAGSSKHLTNFVSDGLEGTVSALYVGHYGEEDANGGIET